MEREGRVSPSVNRPSEVLEVLSSWEAVDCHGNAKMLVIPVNDPLVFSLFLQEESE